MSAELDPPFPLTPPAPIDVPGAGWPAGVLPKRQVTLSPDEMLTLEIGDPSEQYP
jgi:hypothetical protein